jgi:hypothetical protein
VLKKSEFTLEKHIYSNSFAFFVQKWKKKEKKKKFPKQTTGVKPAFRRFIVSI